jgi:hypothetical protein
MATIKTHDLIKCNRIYPTLNSVNPAGLSAFNGLIVKFDNDVARTYTVKKNVQGRFIDARFPSGGDEGAPLGVNTRYSLTSMKFNGVEQIISPNNLTLNLAESLFTSFPLYTMGNEYLYTSNVANAVVVGTSVLDLGLGINNFYQFIESIINANALPIKVSKSPDLWWSNDEFPRIRNFILEKYYNDNFEFTYIDTLIDNSTLVETSETRRHVFNGETVESYVDGILIVAPTEEPQFSDSFSFFSYNYLYDTVIEVPNCPIFNGFNASISTADNCPTINVSCDCKVITFSDTSNYETNGYPGHDPELFLSRKITMTRPNGTTYIWGTSDVVGADKIIQPYLNSSNTFQYTLTSGDSDGIYEFQLCTYPEWSAEVFYDAFLNTIVRRNGKLYKIIASNSNLDPSDVANINYWVEYICTNDCNNTRYCNSSKIVILCISLLKCYKNLVASAFCSMELNPCKPMCDNLQFLNAMKFRVTMDALEFSVCAGDWVSAQKQIDILNKICCCNG